MEGSTDINLQIGMRPRDGNYPLAEETYCDILLSSPTTRKPMDFGSGDGFIGQFRSPSAFMATTMPENVQLWLNLIDALLLNDLEEVGSR